MLSRFVIATPLVVAACAAFAGLAAVPAVAAPLGDCATTPAQLRAAASTADAGTQRKALMLVSTGERLCAVDADLEARKKFAAAARALNVDLAALGTTSTAAISQ